jgi:transcriptional regulator with XRE-family HTH domain
MSLLDWRKYRNLTQEELASQAEVSKTTVNRLEKDPNHRGRGDQLKRIAEALGIDVKELDREPPQPRSSRFPEGKPGDQAEQSGGEENNEAPLAERQAWMELRSRDIRERFGMNDRDMYRQGQAGREEPSATTRIHLQKVLERGLSLDQVEALLFVSVVEHLAQLYERGLNARLREHRIQAMAIRERFAQVLADAERVAQIVYLREMTGGGDLLNRTWDRDLSIDDVRVTLQAIESWESAYGPALEAWIGAGPWWDPQFETPLVDRLEAPAVRLGVIPPSTLPTVPSE